MTTYKILSNDEWIIGIPSDGELCREIRGSGSNKHYLEYVYQTPATPIDIVITGISAVDPTDISHAVDFSTATTYENTTLTVTGAMAYIDTTFSLPIRRNDGRLFVFEAVLVDGVFTALINFPTCGSFTYTNKEANIDLPPNTFAVNPIKFDVRRVITTD